MSLVYITCHDEKIGDIENELPEAADIKRNEYTRKVYLSKYRPMIKTMAKKPHIIDLGGGQKLLTSSKKFAHQTMGFAETPLDPPCEFLRKNHGIRFRKEPEHVCPKSGGLPPVPRFPHPTKPKVDVRLDLAAQKRKKKYVSQDPNCPHPQAFRPRPHRANFVHLNIEKSRASQPKYRPPHYVDTPTGERHNLLNTGLIPQHVCSKNYGKVPPYLRAQNSFLLNMRQQCKEEEKRLAAKCDPQKMYEANLREINNDERQSILQGLKTNLASLFYVYQRLPILTDTHAKRLRKGKLEKDMRQLEQDIYLLESNPIIYISDF